MALRFAADDEIRALVIDTLSRAYRDTHDGVYPWDTTLTQAIEEGFGQPTEGRLHGVDLLVGFLGDEPLDPTLGQTPRKKIAQLLIHVVAGPIRRTEYTEALQRMDRLCSLVRDEWPREGVTQQERATLGITRLETRLIQLDEITDHFTRTVQLDVHLIRRPCPDA